MSLQVSQQYKITEAYISANRLNKELDVSNRLFELTLFESLEKSYLTGVAIITDDAGIFQTLGFTGAETLTVEICPVSPGLDPIVTKTFNMTKIIKSVKANDAAETVMVHLVETHFYINALKRYSRAYTGSLENIITQISTGELQKSVDLSYLTNETTAQGVRKVILPYLTPLEACEWLRDRATSPTGSPLFFYSSIHDDNIRLGDLDKMLSQIPWNSRAPYIYSQAATTTASDGNEYEKSQQILAYEEEDMGDSFGLIEQGCIGSYFTTTDAGNGISYDAHVGADQYLNDMKNSGVVDESDTQLMYDVHQRVGGVGVTGFNSQFFHQMTSSNTYDRFNSYHDGFTSSEYGLKVRNMMARNTLHKNMVNIIVSGTGFMLAKATVGDMMRLQFLSRFASNLGEENMFDKTRSGDYIIYATRHTFRDRRHDVSVDVTRITED